MERNDDETAHQPVYEMHYKTVRGINAVKLYPVSGRTNLQSVRCVGCTSLAGWPTTEIARFVPTLAGRHGGEGNKSSL
jgi:hypothetical protein